MGRRHDWTLRPELMRRKAVPVGNWPTVADIPPGALVLDSDGVVKQKDEKRKIAAPNAAFPGSISVFDYAVKSGVTHDYVFSAPVYTVKRFVDSVNGSDLNDGASVVTAYKNLSYCITALNAIAVESAEIVLLSKIGSATSSSVQAAFDCYIHSVDGTICDVNSGHSGAEESTLYSGTTWRFQFNDVTRVYDLGALDANGLPRALTKLTTSADVVATPGSFAAGSTTYVHLHDGRKPDSNVFLMQTLQLQLFGTNSVIHSKNCRFVGGLILGEVITASFENCQYILGKDSGFECNVSGVVVNNNCVSKWNCGDQFDYRGTAIGYELNCVAGNGYGAIAKSNCSTCHDNSVAVRIASEYQGGAGIQRVIHDINNSKSWNIGCTIDDGEQTDTNYGGPNIANGLFDSASASVIYIDGCTLSGKKLVFTSTLGPLVTYVAPGKDTGTTYVNDEKVSEYVRSYESIEAVLVPISVL